MTTIHSFLPISRADANLLILGSMPGRMSLQRKQYYAHPRNAFWPIAGELFGFDANLSYRQRRRALEQSRTAVWDVLKTCTRNTSLDSDIIESSIVTNDFNRFFAGHPDICLIVFNGAKAERVFLRNVISELDSRHRDIPRVRLPSTSPAHAAMSFDQKLSNWRQALTRA
jgi:hypoxanthine-DNA glycosylase